jgi:hypothetical protein
LGLVDPTWCSYPPEWRALCTLWLRAEAALSKTGLSDLKVTQINTISLPDDIKTWMLNKKISEDGPLPSNDFGKIWTDFLSQRKISEWQDTKDILQEPWCRPGKTGIVIFLLGIYWQAEYSGTGKDWHRNVQRVDNLFNIILSNPAL